MVAAYLLTEMNFPYVLTAVIIGTIATGVVGYLVGLVALRRTGIYFAMITVAIAEVFYFVEFNPLSALHRRRKRAARRADADVLSRLHDHQVQYRLVALYVPGVLVFRRHRARAAYRALAGGRVC